MLKKTSRFTFAFILGFLIIFSSPTLVLAAPIVPDCNTGTVRTIPAMPEKTEIKNGKTIITPATPEKDEYATPCDFNYVMTLINNVITFLLITLATPLFALIIVYVAWLYISAGGDPGNVTKAKKILMNAVIGYVLALAAWLIVKAILVTLGFNGPMYLS